jgi:hypothetical protein
MNALPVLFKVVLAFKGLAAHLAGEGYVVLVTALMDHKIVRFGEASLAILADELNSAFGTHFLSAAKFPAMPLCLHRHYSKHPYEFSPLVGND